MKIVLQIMVATVFFSCTPKKKEAVEIWNIPVIIDTLPTSERYYETQGITVPFNTHIYFGIQKDSIFIEKSNSNLYPFYEKSQNPSDTLKNWNDIEIIPDISQQLSTRQGGYSAPPNLITESEHNSATDSTYYHWKNRNYVRSYPVFIRNRTKDSIFLDNQDGRLFLIQEAKDEHGQWKSIEYWRYAFCGNSYGKTGMGPDDIIVIKKMQYGGTFQTQMRLKLRTNNQIVYSEPYDGSIHIEQFSLDSLDSRAKSNIGDKNYMNSILLYK